jgi:hypothetical protein
MADLDAGSEIFIDYGVEEKDVKKKDYEPKKGTDSDGDMDKH